MDKMYNQIKENIINNFLNKNYLWTCVARKEAVFEDMIDRSPFPFHYDYDNDVLMITLGNKINVAVHFTWNDHENNTYHLVKIY